MEPNPDKLYNLCVKEDYEDYIKNVSNLGPTHKQFENGYQYHYRNGNGCLSKLDGPAIIHKNGTEEYYVDGKHLSKTNWEKHPKVIDFKKTMNQVYNLCVKEDYEEFRKLYRTDISSFYHYKNCYKFYYTSPATFGDEDVRRLPYQPGSFYSGGRLEIIGKLDSNPLVVQYKNQMKDKESKYETKTLPSGIVIENRPDGFEKYCWYIKGTSLYHNEGEPALEHKNGDKYWLQHHKYHRLYGPAVEYFDGSKFYHIDDVYYEEKDYWNHPDVVACGEKMNKKNNDILDVCVKENYDIISNKFPGMHDKYELLKKEYKYAYVSLVDGQDHRLDGPSCETHKGDKTFFINGKIYSKESYWMEPAVIEFKKNSQLFDSQPNFTSLPKATYCPEMGTNQSQIINLTKENKMSKKPLMEMFKEDTVDGAYRSASNQITKGTKAAILSQLSKNTSSEGIAAVSNLLDTEMGGAVMSMLIGMGLTYAPVISEDPRAARLAKEFRVSGISVGMDQLVGLAMNTLMPAFQEAMKSLPTVEVAVKPAKTNKRIKVKEVTSEEDEEEDTELKASKAAR